MRTIKKANKYGHFQGGKNGSKIDIISTEFSTVAQRKQNYYCNIKHLHID